MRSFSLIFSLGLLSACATVKPYEKEYLLHPTMDDTALKNFSSEFSLSAYGEFERLARMGSGANGTTSCPTCGS